MQNKLKVYVAARWHEKARVKELHAKLKELGYGITHDWTEHKEIRPYLQNLDMANTYANVDMQGVIAADIFVLLTHAEIGAGSAGELGAAIALTLTQGKPKIYVVGEHIEHNLFYYHPKVERLASIENLVASLANLKNAGN